MPANQNPFSIVDSLPPEHPTRRALEIMQRYNQVMQNAPQGQQANESNIGYDVRKTLEYPGAVMRRGIESAASVFENALDTPAKKKAREAAAAKARPVAAASVFPTRFDDPRYDAADLAAARATGVPVELLTAIRMRGERSNAGAVSSAGAQTPYQIIPGTRKGIQSKYGVDPWSSPEAAAIGAARVLQEQASDEKGQVNWSDPMTRVRAVAGYFGGAKGAANPFSQDIRDANMSVAEYVNRTLGENLTNPFNPGYLNAAQQQVEQARQAALQPFTLTTEGQPMPEPPAPAPAPKIDFSKAEEHLQALKPVEITAKETETLRWKNFWGGLGQSMMASPEGEGLGSFFLRLGGASLAARGQSMSEIQLKKEEYDNKLAKWQGALYEHDMQKAQIQHQELVADWQRNEQWARDKYTQAMEVWSKTAVPTIIGNSVVVQSIDTKTGKTTMTVQPIPSLINSAYAMEQANLMGQAFGVQNQANAQVAAVKNGIQAQIAMAQAGQVLADQNTTPAEKTAAAAFAPMRAIQYVVDTGQVQSIIGADEFEAMAEDIQKELMVRMDPSNKDYAQAFAEAVKGRLLGVAMRDPKLFEKLMQAVGPAAEISTSYDKYSKRQERTTVDSRGRTQYSTTTGGD